MKIDSSIINNDIGNEIHAVIEDKLYIQKNGDVFNRIKSIELKLNKIRSLKFPLKVHVPWYGKVLAFTCPGQHIYVSRQMAQMCRSDAMLAMVIAHEMAHHDLGHVNIMPEFLTKLFGATITFYLTFFVREIKQFINGPDEECDADLYGLKLCTNAGYDPKECLKLFDIIKKYSLDKGGIETTYGSEASLEYDFGEQTLANRIQKWIDERFAGYYPLRTRIQKLKAYIAEKQYWKKRSSNWLIF